MDFRRNGANTGNLETGEDYFALVGRIAFPVSRAPNFAVVAAAVKRENPEAPAIKVLDKIERGYPYQLDLWLGDPEAFMQAVSDFNDRLVRAPDVPMK